MPQSFTNLLTFCLETKVAVSLCIAQQDLNLKLKRQCYVLFTKEAESALVFPKTTSLCQFLQRLVWTCGILSQVLTAMGLMPA